MSGEKKGYIYKEVDGGGKEFFSMIIYRPLARFLLLSIFRFTSITPNQITLISLCFAIVAALYLAFFTYPAIILALLFLHLTYTFDMLDGVYARYKGLTSKLGKWFDSFVDLIKLSAIFISLNYAAYKAENKIMVFIWGMLATTNVFLSVYLLNTRDQLMKIPPFEVKFGKNIYFGFEISLYWIISLFVLFNKIYAGLIFLGTAGILLWLKPYITLMRYYKRHKEEIEKG